MTDTFFEIAFEGTSVEDCMRIHKILQEEKGSGIIDSSDNNIIVFDKQKEYGTTYKAIEDLSFNKMVKRVQIRKNRSKILFETDPQFLRQTDEIINFINDAGTAGFCDFLPINSHYLILEDGKYYKIPYSKSELVDTPFFTFKERHLVNRFVKDEITLETLRKKLSDRCKQILLNGLIGSDKNHDQKIFEYLNNFEGHPFVYPKHGLKDISELLSRSNAINGTSYLLDPSLKIYAFKKFNINDKECINVENKETDKKNRLRKKSKCTKNSIDQMEMCDCIEESDILDRFNTRDSGSDESSEEYIDTENDHNGQLYIQERDCCSNEGEAESSFLLCQKQTIDDENITYLMDKLNVTSCEFKPFFLQNEDIKIKIEDITNKNQNNNFIMKGLELSENAVDISLDRYIDYLNNGYKYLIKSEHGNIFAKKIYKKEFTGTKKYVRILNITQKVIKDRFFAWFYNGNEFIKVLIIDSNSKCCKKGTYIFYLIKDDKEITDRDLEMLDIHECDILIDVSFELWDYKHIMYS
ncbi:hypothetical protein P3W45_000067 [Vairimorpha bombi]|jgi:RAB protein geranylgeranyltransferase component A